MEKRGRVRLDRVRLDRVRLLSGFPALAHTSHAWGRQAKRRLDSWEFRKCPPAPDKRRWLARPPDWGPPVELLAIMISNKLGAATKTIALLSATALWVDGRTMNAAPMDVLVVI